MKLKKSSDRLVTLLTAYTLCKEAIDHQRVLKEHVTESMFQAGIISYYSIFKDKEKGAKEWFLGVLSGEKAPVGLLIGTERMDKNLGETLISIFQKFESIRDKNLAHKDPSRNLENRKEWLQIPEQVAGSNTIGKGIMYIVHNILSLSQRDKSEFLTLIRASIDIIWQKEGLEIFQYQQDGSVRFIDAPSLNWNDES